MFESEFLTANKIIGDISDSVQVADPASRCSDHRLHSVAVKIIGENSEPVKMPVQTLLKNRKGQVLRGKTNTSGECVFHGLDESRYTLVLFSLDREACEYTSDSPFDNNNTFKITPDWRTDQTLTPRQEKVHSVKQGECVSSLANEYGLLKKTIWESDRNSALRKKRKDQHVLYPGDTLYIPAIEPYSISTNTGRKYIITRKGFPEKLSVRFLDHLGMPDSNAPFLLHITDAKTIFHQDILSELDDNGFINEYISPSTKEAKITLRGRWGEESYTMAIGYLDPESTISGLQARLNNLGIDIGDIDNKLGEKTQGGIMQFQQYHNLTPNGEFDSQTINKLIDISLI